MFTECGALQVCCSPVITWLVIILTIVSHLIYIFNFITEEKHMLSLKILLWIERDAPRKSKSFDLKKYDVEQSVSVEGEAGWAPEPVWMHRRGEKSPASDGNWTAFRHSSSLRPSQYTDFITLASSVAVWCILVLDNLFHYSGSLLEPHPVFFQCLKN
jgi:hypothetical protein